MINILNKYNIGKKKLIGIVIFVILFLIALPLTIIQVQKQQEIRQRAEGLNNVYLELKPLRDGKNAINAQFVQTLYLQNPLNKDISAVDITLTYNKDHLDVVDFITEGNLSDVIKDTSIPGEVHFVGINSRQTHIIDSAIPLGAFILKAKKEGNGTIDFSKVLITATGETQPLTINPADNKPAAYAIEQPTQTSEPTPTASSSNSQSVSPSVAPQIYTTPFSITIPPTPTPVPPPSIPEPPKIQLTLDKQIIFEGETIGVYVKVDSNADGLFLFFGTSNEIPTDKYTFYEYCDPKKECSVSFFIPVPEGNILKIIVKAHTYPENQIEDAVKSIPIRHRPPFISNIDIDPHMGQVGTKYVTYALVTSKDSLQSVKATVRYEGNGPIIYEEIIQLYDDGTHGDDKAGDGYYVNVWDSNRKGLPKEIVIEAKDTDGNISSLSNAFEPTEEACREAAPGHNDKNGKRVNIVFAGANYGSIEAFSKEVEQVLDFNGVRGGLFSQEPFRSNKDKFNFWYSNQIGSIKGCDLEKLPKSLLSLAQCRAVIRVTARSCIIGSKYTIGLINMASRSFSLGATTYNFNSIFNSGKIYAEPLEISVIHEFGHSFGKLQDEYVGSNIFASGIPERLIGEEKSTEDHNIFKGSREACLSIKNPWYNLIGRGCGTDNVIDCTENYNADKDEITCVPGVDKEACYKEVGCFKGAGSPDNFRSSFSTVMRNARSVDTKTFSRSYGPVNERELCKKIKKTTGSAGGICSEYDL